MKKFLFFLLSVMLCSATLMAQQTISGTVVSADDDEPLVGATILPLPLGSASGMASDVDGNFTIKVPATCHELQVSFVGMVTRTVRIPHKIEGKLLIKLAHDENRLEEVIAVAYGTSKRSEYTGSASVVKADQIADVLTSSVTTALQGRTSGVTVQSSDGAPGSAPTLRIRGVGSINASSNPLIVVDGVPFSGAISDIAPSDVESMTVLKDAAANSLYGARGANGVVLITTKRGASGAARITFDATWGQNRRAMPNYNVISSTNQYYELMYEGEYNNNLQRSNPQSAWIAANQKLIQKATGYQIYTVPQGEYLVGRNGKINPNATLGYSNGTNYFTPDNWMNETLRYGLRQSYNLSISGGNDKIKYFVSGSFLGDDGIIKNSDYNRLSTRATVDYQAKTWLKIGTNLNYTYTKSNRPGEMDLDAATSSGNAFYIANQIAPIYPFYVRDADGNVMLDAATGHRIFDYGDGKSTRFSRQFMSMSNPIGDLTYNTDENMSDVFDGKWYATITPIDGLNITGNAGYWVTNDRNHYNTNPFYGQASTGGGEAQQYFARQYSINLQALATYTKTFAENHNMDLMVGYETFHTDNEIAYAYGKNLYNPYGWNVTNAIDGRTGSGYRSIDYTTRGILARGKYNYAGRYFFQASYRRDASSRFAPEHRWGNFFSVSGAWDIAKEKFMQDVTAVDQLKFKVSFGQNGNDNLGSSSYYYYAYQDQYQANGADGVWNDATLIYKGNRDITWETSNNFNVGFDFSFFQGKLDGSIEYFQRQVSDMLFFLPAAPSLGYASFPVNVGSMRNYGAEIELNYNIFNTPDFSWSINANLTTMGNKIVKLPTELVKDGKWINGARIYEEGQSMYQIYYPSYAGVNEANGEAQYWAKFDDQYYASHPELAASGIAQEFKTGTYTVTNPDGTTYTLSANYDDVYDGNSDKGLVENRKASGSLLPKVYGGFGTTLYAYGVDLSVTFSYQAGGKIYDSTYAGLMHGMSSSSNFGRNWHTDILNRWTPENTNTDVPRINSGDKYTASASDRFYTSSDFLSLNNITLGYTFPGKWTRSIGIESIRLYGVAENIAMWTKRRGIDPRQGFVSSNSSTYSPIRTISGGLRVQF